jgi:hypothetical protein
MLKDQVHVFDQGSVRVGEELREWGEKSIVEVEGWVSLCLRERGKIVQGSRREGKNIWTNTGREYLALLMSLATAPTTPFRSDSMAYIGVGTGSQLESASVLSLAAPVAFNTGVFLAALDVPPTFPLSPVRTTVQYHRIFLETDITISPGTVNVSELGLFTNGDPGSSYAPGTRNTTFAAATSQAPNAYKTFEPVGKTNALQLEVSWQIRF